MIAFAHNNLAFSISKHTSPLCSRRPVSSSLSPHFFLSATQIQLSIGPNFCSSATETQLSTSLSDILLNKYDFPPELASLVASKLTHPENFDKAYAVLSFLKENGFSNTQLIKMVRCKPEFLVGSVENTLKPNIKSFQEFGFSSSDICEFVSRRPAILHSRLHNDIALSLSVLMGLLGSNKEVARVIRKYPFILSANLKNTLLQNVEFLEGCGIPMNGICTALHTYPFCFMRDPEVVKKAAEKAKEMGLDAGSNKFIYAIPTLVSMSDEAWEAKLQGLRDSGFLDGDILTMFRNAPQVFMVSMEKMKKVIELLLATGKFDLSSIVSYPMSLTFSVKKRYIPRLPILGILESRNLIQGWPGLATICQLTDARFFEKFIRPYLNEVSDVDIIKSYVKTRMKYTSPVCSRSPVSSSLSATKTQLRISLSDILLHKYDFPPKLASRVASRLTYLENPDKAYSVFSFFKENGFSNTQLIKMVRRKPQFLTSSVEDTFKPKIKFFQEFGFSLDDICELVSRSPSILYLSLHNDIIPSLSVLRGWLGSNKAVARVIRKSPFILSANLKNRVLQNVEFLEGFGIHINRICAVLNIYPYCFLCYPEIVKKAAEKAKEMGLDTGSNKFIYAIPTLVSMSDEAWEAKLKALRDLGFSDRDILAMFRKAPLAFYGSVEKIKKIIELLLATGKFDLSSIVTYPMSLTFSIKKRYIPRLQIFGILEIRNLIQEWPGLPTICQLTDARFFEKFIRPYLNEVSDVDIIMSYVKTTMKSESLGKDQ